MPIAERMPRRHRDHPARTSGGAVIWTYADQGRPEDRYNLKGYFFDCQGDYVTMELVDSDWIDAPPRSVAAQIQALACGS